MKKILFITASIVSLNIYSQSNIYKPFPEAYGNWWVRTGTYPGGNSSGPIYDTLLYTSGDSVINALTYKKINRISEGTAHGPVPPLNSNYTGGIYSFSYRNDSLNKKVYIIPNNTQQEILWYDFNLQIGDTIKNTYSVGSNLVIVQSIDSVLICNNYYRSYVVSCSAPFGGGNSQGGYMLIESAGFTANFVNMNFSSNCYFEPFTIASTTSWSEDACPDDWAGIKNYSRNTIDVKIYPNPSSNVLNMKFESNDETGTISIKNFLGQEVTNQKIELSTNYIQINTANLSNGIYFVSSQTNSGSNIQKIIVQH